MILAMTITLTWWHLPVLLAVIPFPIAFVIYARADLDDWGAPLLAIAIFIGCWSGAVFTLIGHFL